MIIVFQSQHKQVHLAIGRRNSDRSVHRTCVNTHVASFIYIPILNLTARQHVLSASTVCWTMGKTRDKA
eukprot:15347047-Ditylum_brightwellii.AAC.1